MWRWIRICNVVAGLWKIHGAGSITRHIEYVSTFQVLSAVVVSKILLHTHFDTEKMSQPLSQVHYASLTSLKVTHDFSRCKFGSVSTENSLKSISLDPGTIFSMSSKHSMPWINYRYILETYWNASRAHRDIP